MKPFSQLKTIAFYLCIGLVTFINGLSGPFMLDDHAFFTPQIRDIRYVPSYFLPPAYASNDGLPATAVQPNFYYRPFAQALPAIQYFCFGTRTLFYHLTNLILLILAACCVFLLIDAVFANHWLALVTGALFIMHPINGLLVNYITASVFSLQVIFMCLSLLFLLKQAARPQRLAWSGIFFALALLCHETALLLPAYAVGMLVIKGYARPHIRRLGQPLAIMAAVYLFLHFQYVSLNNSLLGKFARFDMNAVEYAASVGRLMGWYLSKLMLPIDIVLIWATPVVREMTAWWILLLVAFIGLLTVVIMHARNYPALRLGAWWLGFGFLPLPFACLFQPPHGPMIEPHWFVFPVIGFLLMLASWLTHGLTRISLFRRYVWTAVAALLVLFSWNHNWLWANEERYALHWVAQAPTMKAVWFHLGEINMNNDRYHEAQAYYEHSLRGTYQDYLAYQRMGFAALKTGDEQQARVNFLLSLKIEPRQRSLQQFISDDNKNNPLYGH